MLHQNWLNIVYIFCCTSLFHIALQTALFTMQSSISSKTILIYKYKTHK